MEEIRRAGKGGGPLPLHEDDMTEAFGGAKPPLAEEVPWRGQGISSIQLFFTIVVAAPIAALLVLLVMDLYEPISKNLGLSGEPASTVPAGASANEQEEKRLAMWVDLIEKNNKALVKSINKQTNAVLRLAKKKPGKINIPPAKTKVIVVKVPTKESFSLTYEKTKLLDLAGVDIDDPVVEASFDSVSSRQVLKEVIRSLDSIIKASQAGSGISPFLKNNALKAKKYARQRLSKI